MVTTDRFTLTEFNGIPLHTEHPPASAFAPIDEAAEERLIAGLRERLRLAREERQRADNAAIAAREDHLRILADPEAYSATEGNRVASARWRLEGWQADADREEGEARRALNAALRAKAERARAATFRQIAARDAARQSLRAEGRKAAARALGYTPLPEKRARLPLRLIDRLRTRKPTEGAESDPGALTV
jgi:hypothetical protein